MKDMTDKAKEEDKAREQYMLYQAWIIYGSKLTGSAGQNNEV